ncbi:MAG TPA: GNAT family N-acetyltransferase [Xanthobacteraceae bacterium]|nr:GNAT family N-acetyltransferase [Xanthobacteraceae bacterium]
MASIGSQFAPRVAPERTVSAIASARRAALAERYATAALAVEWRWLFELGAIEQQWRRLADRALEPNVFYEPGFALAAAPAFGREAGAVLVWSGTQPRQLLGLFPARATERRYGLKLPVLVGWTHPYAPLGTPLIEREAAEPVIAAWLAYFAADPSLPGLLLLPLIAADGAFATALAATLRRVQMPSADFDRHRRALLAPQGDRSGYLERTLDTRQSYNLRRNLRRSWRRLNALGAVSFTAATERSAVAAAIEDFFALEASGWKGKVGTAALFHDDVRSFMTTALAALAAQRQVTVDRITLDGRAIAAAIVLRSANAAWFWKIAHDDALARYSPGVMIAAAVTEQLLDDGEITQADSCAGAGHPMIDRMWRERLTLCDRLIAVRPDAPFSQVRRLETLRRIAVATAKSIRRPLRGRR